MGTYEAVARIEPTAASRASCLGPQGSARWPATGFLPACIPTDALPGPWEAHAHACGLLAARYHRDDGDVRPWLATAFATWDDRHHEALRNASDSVCDGAMTAVSMLAHAYRWGAMPAVPDALGHDVIELPPGLARPLRALSERLGVPACGNLFHMVLANWRWPGAAPGSTYAPARLRADIERVTPMYGWLQGSAADHLAATLRCLLLTEIAGAEMLPAVLGLCDAALRHDAQAAVVHLHTVRAGIAAVSAVLGRYMRPQTIAPEVFLSVIQPHFGWGLSHAGVRLDGACGAQTTTIQLLDAVFGVPRASAVGAMAHHARRYLPWKQRALLEAIDRRAPIVRAFVADHADPDAPALWNDCLNTLHQWRRAHQKRGALYLRAENARYHSVGGLVTVEDSAVRAAAYDRAMEEHMQETLAARLPCAGAGDK